MDNLLYAFEKVNFYCLLILIFIMFSWGYRAVYRGSKAENYKLRFGLFIVGLMFFVVFVAYRTDWLMDQTFDFSGVLISTAITGLFMWAIAKSVILPLTPSKHFESKYEDGKFVPTYKEVKDVSSWRISVYPRISIYNLDSDNGPKLIFDSSDFKLIIEVFGAIDGLQETFREEYEFMFRNQKMVAEDVQVDFMCLFDDYSGGRTRVHEGEDTPYNIQIIVRAKFIKNEEFLSSEKRGSTIKSKELGQTKVFNQVWTEKNISIKSFSNGDQILQAQSNAEWRDALSEKTPAWCYINNDPDSAKNFGILYNGYCVADERNIAPVGWLIPTFDDWSNLLSEIDCNVETLLQDDSFNLKLNGSRYYDFGTEDGNNFKFKFKFENVSFLSSTINLEKECINQLSIYKSDENKYKIDTCVLGFDRGYSIRLIKDVE